jgi:hypothetical protein
MADLVIFAMAIASAVSLLIVSPHEAQRNALRALRAYGETEALPIGGHGEDLARLALGGPPHNAALAQTTSRTPRAVRNMETPVEK